MKLDKKDRFIIANQLKILEALYPEEASSYATHRTAIEEGYVSHYEWAMESISDEELTPETTREVIDTLDMFRALYFYRREKDMSDINERSMKFKGYDGNDSHECKMMAYARYFVVELERFTEIIEEQGEYFDFNSHCMMRENYQEMLQRWLKIEPGRQEGQRHNLTKDQVKSIIGE
ncbi:YfbU family protein [Halobacteriovorax sp. ZH1_bin.1]|uniref:YfbU family protein n=1 Tax=Halobacteriovorax sp. ZH1_bin.1 TaxID=3157723 RepID=UPI00371E667E